MEQTGAVADKHQQFQASSADWHRVLGVQDGVDEKTSKKRKRALLETEADEARVYRSIASSIRAMVVELSRDETIELRRGLVFGRA
jgi:hypothetical protein